MVVTFFSIGCLVFLSFLIGLFTFFYISSQLSHKEDINCQLETNSKIGYKRNSIK